METIKILIFNWRCWLNPAMGGAEVFTHEVSKRWVESGHEVTLFTSEFPNCKREEMADGVRIVRSGGKYSVYRNAKKQYRKSFSKEDYDVVIDEINTRPFFTPKFVSHGEKIFALIHQLAREYWFYEMPFPLGYLGYRYFEEEWLKGYIDVPTVTVSESSRRDLVDFGFQKVWVVPEGLNFEPLAAVPERDMVPIVVYAGRLKRAKRPDDAVKAFQIIKEKVPSAQLWFLGDGPFRGTLERMAGRGTRFFGHLPDKERRRLLGKAWVLVNPSVREGWGLNVIEANALGVPVVAYDVAGLRNSVRDGVTGLLAKDGNVEDLAEKTVSVLTDGGLMRQLSEEALAYSKSFSWDKTAAEFMKAICLG